MHRVGSTADGYSLLQTERLERLRAVLDPLPGSVQRVLKWRDEDGLTLGQVAERVERSEDALRMLISRCLTRLRPEIFDDESKL